MSVLTQGTEVFFIDPDDLSIVKILKITAFNPGGDPKDQIEDTGLEDHGKTFKKGLSTPGTASITVNADPQFASHVRLSELNDETTDRDIKFVVGWADGTAPPTADSDGVFVLPTTRTWYRFNGYVADFPMDFAMNTLVVTAATIQRSTLPAGEAVWTPKEAPSA